MLMQFDLDIPARTEDGRLLVFEARAEVEVVRPNMFCPYEVPGDAEVRWRWLRDPRSGYKLDELTFAERHGVDLGPFARALLHSLREPHLAKATPPEDDPILEMIR